ncbi:oligosaccharide flippase family protein [Deminuibacter soli]|uniref:Uncharacterized protein n=1 Tax=Deminuibacter soli TaxID=2291815 RepID=A0A3E1NQH4_9BACT|nr:oligosaccharide flippase family protein [Deminuibacter soli]RFM30176.1 hypothetical protein DXN05_04175 [Deminuibacter soli]
MKKYFSSYWIRSAFYAVLQRFSLTFFGFVNFLILIRWLSQPQMAVWALFLTITTVFEITKSGLLKNAHVKYVSASDDVNQRTAIASSSFIINASISVAFIVFLLLCSGWLGTVLHAGADLGIALRWFIPGLVFMVMFSHFEAVQQSHLDFKGVFAGYMVRQVSFFAAISLHYLLHLPVSFFWLSLYMSGSIFIGAIVLFIYSRKYLTLQFSPTRQSVKVIFSYGGYIFGSGVMSNIFANLDQIMTAGFISNPASVACYSAASRINGLVDIPSYAAADILFPKSARAAAEDDSGKVKYLYERMVGTLLTFTLPLALFIIAFAKPVIVLIAGERYIPAALILQLYMMMGLLRPVQNQAANLLNSIGKAALCFWINTISLACNLCINYFCLRTFGFYGAVIGTLITTTLGTIAWYLVMRKQIGLEMPSIIRHMMDLYKRLYSLGMNTVFKQKNVIMRN